jgi:hypothetical protein
MDRYSKARGGDRDIQVALSAAELCNFTSEVRAFSENKSVRANLSARRLDTFRTNFRSRISKVLAFLVSRVQQIRIDYLASL